MWPFDRNNHAVYQEYAQAYDTGNYAGINHQQAFGHLQQFMQNAPTDFQQQVYQQHFSQLPYEHRALLAQQLPPEYYADPNDPWSLAQSFTRLGQEQPHLLQRVLSHPILLGGMVGLTALIAKHALAHHQAQAQNQGYAYNNQGFAYNNQGFSNQGGYQDPAYLQQELYQARQEEQELRRELQAEEQRDAYQQGQQGQHHHHHRRENEY